MERPSRYALCGSWCQVECCRDGVGLAQCNTTQDNLQGTSGFHGSAATPWDTSLSHLRGDGMQRALRARFSLDQIWSGSTALGLDSSFSWFRAIRAMPIKGGLASTSRLTISTKVGFRWALC